MHLAVLLTARLSLELLPLAKCSVMRSLDHTLYSVGDHDSCFTQEAGSMLSLSIAYHSDDNGRVNTRDV